MIPINFKALVSLYIPLICFEFYKAVKPPKEHEFVFLISNLFWLVSAAGILTVIVAFGSKVSEKVYNLETILFSRYSFWIGFLIRYRAQIRVGFTSLRYAIGFKNTHNFFIQDQK